MESLIIYGDSAALWRASKAMSIAAFAAKTAVDWTIQSLFHAGPGISSIAISFDLPSLSRMILPFLGTSWDHA